MQEETQVLTDYQRRKYETDRHIYDMYHQLIDRGAKKMAVMDAIKSKYYLHSYRPIYDSLRREEKRRENRV
jgi:hypothetical protein